MDNEAIEKKVMGVRQEALSYLEQVENDFVREALLAMFDVKKPMPSEHAWGLIRVCRQFDKTPEDFMLEWNSDKKTKALTKKALNLFHRTVNAETAKSYDRIYFWLRTIVFVAKGIMTDDTHKKIDSNQKAHNDLETSRYFV